MLTSRTFDFKKYVNWAYKSDFNVISKWHTGASLGFAACVEREVSDFKSMPSFELFVVKDNGYPVGYFGSESDGSYMPTIFVHPAYRNEKKRFWDEIKKKMQEIWHAGIFIKNIPCYKFYAKMGKEINQVESKDGPIAIFEFVRSH